jgi:hypothetical protein
MLALEGKDHEISNFFTFLQVIKIKIKIKTSLDLINVWLYILKQTKQIFLHYNIEKIVLQIRNIPIRSLL